MKKVDNKNERLANAFKNIEEEMKYILTDKQYDDFTNKLSNMYMQYYKKPKKVKTKTVGATITPKTIDKLWGIRDIISLYACITDMEETKDISLFYLSGAEIYNIWDKIPNKELLIDNYNDIATEKPVYNINYSNVNKFFKQLLKENNWKKINFNKLKTVPVDWFEQPIIVESSNELLSNGEVRYPAKDTDKDIIFNKEVFPFASIFHTHFCKVEKRIIYIKK